MNKLRGIEPRFPAYIRNQSEIFVRTRSAQFLTLRLNYM